MLHKLIKPLKTIQASTLMETLVALAITTLMIWFVFKSIPNTFTGVNPERKLEAIFLADSLLNSQLQLIPNQETADTTLLKGFRIERSISSYDTLSSVRQISVRVMAGKHVLAERSRLAAIDSHEKKD